MTTKIINEKNPKYILGSSLKTLSEGTAIYSIRSAILYIVSEAGIVRVVDGQFMHWSNVGEAAQFEIVDIEVHIK